MSGFVEKAGVDKDFQFLLIGNKADATNDRKVEKSRVQRFMQDNNIYDYFETSAKENVQIETIFTSLYETCLKTIRKKPMPKPMEFGKFTRG